MRDDRRIKCLYCDHTVAAWWRDRNGKSHSGMAAMMTHVTEEHTPTYLLPSRTAAFDTEYDE